LLISMAAHPWRNSAHQFDVVGPMSALAVSSAARFADELAN
jgi:hypothetical protein